MDLLSDGAAEFGLQAEKIVGRTIVGFSPDLQLVARANQLHRNPKLPTGAANRAFDQVISAKLAGDFAERPGSAVPVRDARRSANHTQVFGIDLSEFRDRLLGEPVGNVVLVRVALKILKR